MWRPVNVDERPFVRYVVALLHLDALHRGPLMTRGTADDNCVVAGSGPGVRRLAPSRRADSRQLMQPFCAFSLWVLTWSPIEMAANNSA